MRTIPHRELRNDSSRILEQVRNGETIEVTNHGEPVAVLVPPSMSSYDRLVASGRIRVASPDSAVDLRRIHRRTASTTTADLLADLREDR